MWKEGVYVEDESKGRSNNVNMQYDDGEVWMGCVCLSESGAALWFLLQIATSTGLVLFWPDPIINCYFHAEWEGDKG